MYSYLDGDISCNASNLRCQISLFRCCLQCSGVNMKLSLWFWKHCAQIFVALNCHLFEVVFERSKLNGTFLSYSLAQFCIRAKLLNPRFSCYRNAQLQCGCHSSFWNLPKTLDVKFAMCQISLFSCCLHCSAGCVGGSQFSNDLSTIMAKYSQKWPLSPKAKHGWL